MGGRISMDFIVTTPAQEHYVEALYNLSFEGPVRPSLLADSLGVKRASVSKFIRTLVEQGLVTRIPRGKLSLTEAGIELARSIQRRDRCLSRLLVEVCNMTPEAARAEVHRLEHFISDDVLARLETLVEFACSSRAWLKRLHLRMTAEQTLPEDQRRITAGMTPVHQGKTKKGFSDQSVDHHDEDH
ncbi:MAG: metal-dependent transcriptional regulator [Desulfofustis sp.]